MPRTLTPLLLYPISLPFFSFLLSPSLPSIKIWLRRSSPSAPPPHSRSWEVIKGGGEESAACLAERRIWNSPPPPSLLLSPPFPCRAFSGKKEGKSKIWENGFDSSPSSLFPLFLLSALALPFSDLLHRLFRPSFQRYRATPSDASELRKWICFLLALFFCSYLQKSCFLHKRFLPFSSC